MSDPKIVNAQVECDKQRDLTSKKRKVQADCQSKYNKLAEKDAKKDEHISNFTEKNTTKIGKLDKEEDDLKKKHNAQMEKEKIAITKKEAKINKHEAKAKENIKKAE
eukprot:Awhi_evm1s3090